MWIYPYSPVMCERLVCRTLCHELYISTLKFLSNSMQATSVIENLKLLEPCSEFVSQYYLHLKTILAFSSQMFQHHVLASALKKECCIIQRHTVGLKTKFALSMLFFTDFSMIYCSSTWSLPILWSSLHKFHSGLK